MSNTNPIPASEFRRLADDAIDRLASALQFLSEEQGAAVHAYRAARAASPVTLEEQMLIMGNRFENDQLTLEQEEEWERTTREHARRLAGEGGA